ncbi:MAG: hypothetical protein WCX71_02615 [Candidatus Buchananbacteria bacterium]
MDDFYIKINQLVIKTNGKQKTFVRTFATKPSNGLQVKMGKLFGLIEIESSSPKISNLIDIIVQEIKNNYYQPDFQPSIETATLTEQFEKALKKTNIAIASFIEGQQITLDLNKVNIVVGLVYNQEIHLAQVGDIGAIIFYNVQDNNYRIINIIEATKAPITSPDPLKLFSQLISGKIRAKDLIFITTANLLDYFSLDRLKIILTCRTIDESLVELKGLIEKTNSRENFGLLALELEKNLVQDSKTIVVEEFTFEQGGFRQSMKELIKTEQETEKFLTPSVLPEFKKYFNSLQNQSFGLFEKLRSSLRSHEKISKKISDPYIHLPTVLKKKPSLNLRPLKNILSIFTPIINVTRAIFNILKIKVLRIGQKPAIAKYFNLITNFIKHWLKNFGRLPKSSQLLLITTVILAFLFTGSLGWLAINNHNQIISDNFNQSILEAESKKNSAESSLIYRDENQARELLIEAKNLAAQIQPRSKYQQDYLNNFNQSIKEQLQKLQHLVEIAEPIQIANFSNLDNQAQIGNSGALAGKYYFAINSGNQGLYKTNINNKVISFIPEPNGAFLASWFNDKQILLLGASNKFYTLDLADDSIKPANFSVDAKLKILDINTFSGQVYLLTDQGKILKNKGNQFESWLKEDRTDLNNAQSLFVDGQLYLLKNDGLILKFESGKQVELKFSSIDPAFSHPTKIKTTANYIYILDPKEKRLVVFDKPDPKDKKNTATIISQYTSPAFSDLKDFAVNEKDKKIYLLSGTTLYGIAADYIK